MKEQKKTPQKDIIPDYTDILHMSRPASLKHRSMEMTERAAQFSPFAALTGYGDAIKETGRQTHDRMELDEDWKVQLDESLQQLLEREDSQAEAAITFFRQDLKKNGGEYVTVTGRIKRIDTDSGAMIMENGERILLREIISIERIL